MANQNAPSTLSTVLVFSIRDYVFRPAEIISVSVKKSNASNNYDGERCRPKLSGLSNNA